VLDVPACPTGAPAAAAPPLDAPLTPEFPAGGSEEQAPQASSPASADTESSFIVRLMSAKWALYALKALKKRRDQRRCFRP
jgi:hypothetical protein